MYKEVSIIITHYEDPFGLENLLKSIYKEGISYEVIVVDDCSKKNIKQLEQIKKRYYQVIWVENLQNIGAGLSRNVGLTNASKEWILFADSDDEFLPGFSKIISSSAISKNDLIYFPPKLSSEIVKQNDYRKKYVKLVNDFFAKKKYAELNLRTQFGIGHSKLIRRKLISDNRLHYENRMMFEDSLFNLQIGLLAKNVGVDRRSIYLINNNKESLSSSKNISYNKDYTEVMVERYLFERSHLTYNELKNLKATRINLCFHVLVTTKKISYVFMAIKTLFYKRKLY